MSNLWICREETAKKPFFLEEAGVKIWTIEELCFYFFHNMDNLDEGILNEELFMWLSEELKMPRLATALLQEKKQGRSAIWCAWFLLRETGIYSAEELEELRIFCFAMEQKDEFEQQKLKADRLFQNERYLRSIMAYRMLLQKEEEKQKHQKLMGDIYHNMGVAHTRLFLFGEAAEYFKEAYELNQRQESLAAYEMAQKMSEPVEQSPSLEIAEETEQDWSSCLRWLREEYKKKVI